ncbi:MAG: GYF domain-containing protein, partial [Myxococcota bacterium]
MKQRELHDRLCTVPHHPGGTWGIARMKIECDKCAAKYSIADEKVRGKTFKIRCKKCSNVIIVRDKGAAAAAGAAAAPAADHAPGWHLAINGETVGPMAEDEVRQRYDAGEIDKETAVWQEGFEDWVPLGDVDVFGNLPERAPAAAAEDPFASANQDDYAAPAAVGAVAAGGGAAPMEQARSPRVSQLTGQRNENSVLFSLDSLQSLAPRGGGGGGGGGGAAAAAAPQAAPAPAQPP